MHFDCSQPPENQASARICRKVDCSLSADGSSKTSKVKVKIKSLKIFCQQLKPPISAIDTFTLPQHWSAFGDATTDTPGQYYHMYKPAEKAKTAWRFWCSGLRLHEDDSTAFRKLLSPSTPLTAANDALQNLDSNELKSLVTQSTHSKIAKLSSAEVIDWNGRRVLTCNYLANPAEEAFCDFKEGPLLKAWALVYENAHLIGGLETNRAELSASPASIELIGSSDDFEAQLNAVRTAAKTIKWR